MKIRFLFLATLLSLSVSTAALAQFKAGDTAPDFSALTLDNQNVKLSDFRGKTLLVEMGTTWCPSCNELAHIIDSMRNDLNAQEILYLGVYLADSAESIRSHLQKEALKSPDQILIDSGEARRNYSVFSIPRLLLIDENFKIVFDEMILNAKELQRRINRQLSRH